MMRTLADRIAAPRWLASAMGTMWLAGAAFAQQPPPPPGVAPAGGEPPAVVGRIAEVSGTVSHKAAAATEWEKADRNWPIVVGDAIYAAGDGQARLEIGMALVTVRPNAVVDLAALDDRSVSLRADSGTATVATPVGGEAFTLLTPRGGAALGPDGLYRISAGDESAPTEIAVCRGGVVLADGQTRLREGEMAVLSGDPAAPQARIAAAPPGGCDAAPLQEARLPPKVSRRLTGIRDLAERGRWSHAANGADVWFPDDVGDSWAPYRNGRWNWVAPWGWTWVDDAPWGFAPFHYGRWSEIDGRWGWLPGEYVERPVYAPALVAFIAPPPDAVVVGGPEPVFGWVPLGPTEVYRPYYVTPGIDYARRVNLNVAGVGAATIGALIAAPLAVAALSNRRVATVVPLAALNGGRPVAPAILQTKPQVLASTPVQPGGQPPMPRPPGTLRVPSVPGARVAAPPRPIPPLAVRPGAPLGVVPGGRGPQPLTPPVMAPGRTPPLPGGPMDGRPPAAPPKKDTTGTLPGGARGTGPLPAGPGARPGPIPRGPRPAGPEARPTLARPATPVRPPAAGRPAPAVRPAAVPRPAPVARPAARPTPVARPAPMVRPAPMARPAAPVARPAPMARPAPAARPAPRPAPPQAKKPHP